MEYLSNGFDTCLNDFLYVSVAQSESFNNTSITNSLIGLKWIYLSNFGIIFVHWLLLLILVLYSASFRNDECTI